MIKTKSRQICDDNDVSHQTATLGNRLTLSDEADLTAHNFAILTPILSTV